MKSNSTHMLAWALLACATQVSQAAIVGVTGGAAAPNATLGGYTMTSFADDTRATWDSVDSVTDPVNGTVTFSDSVDHFKVGDGWSTWSHNYQGDVYSSTADTITLTLPANTGAFYLYAQPNQTAEFTVTANGVSQLVNGDAGASYFGFYATGGDTLSMITISTTDATGLGIGEFAFAPVPEARQLSGVAGLMACIGLSFWLGRNRNATV